MSTTVQSTVQMECLRCCKVLFYILLRSFWTFIQIQNRSRNSFGLPLISLYVSLYISLHKREVGWSLSPTDLPDVRTQWKQMPSNHSSPRSLPKATPNVSPVWRFSIHPGFFSDCDFHFISPSYPIFSSTFLLIFNAKKRIFMQGGGYLSPITSIPLKPRYTLLAGWGGGVLFQVLSFVGGGVASFEVGDEIPDVSCFISWVLDWRMLELSIFCVLIFTGGPPLPSLLSWGPILRDFLCGLWTLPSKAFVWGQRTIAKKSHKSVNKNK